LERVCGGPDVCAATLSNSDGDVVLTGAVLTQVGIQLPTFEPEQACLLHLTSAD